MRVKANKRTYAIGLYLLSGFTPWGVELIRREGEPPALSLCRPREWIMCCGHVLRTHEVERWKAAGLVIDGPPDRFDRPTIVAGPRLEAWVSAAFHQLRARTWGNAA